MACFMYEEIDCVNDPNNERTMTARCVILIIGHQIECQVTNEQYADYIDDEFEFIHTINKYNDSLLIIETRVNISLFDILWL